MASAKKRGLGKGLGALIGEKAFPLDELTADEPKALPDGTELLLLDPKTVQPNPKQPRQVFDEEALQELAESIRRDGVQEPVLVRRRDSVYELVSGERRVRASVLADLDHVPAICRDVSDRDMLKLGIIENIQREDLNAVELARAYEQLIEEFGWTQEEMAAEVGKKRATVTNTLRLLNLPDVVQEMVADGSISMGHARALLAIETPEGQSAAARKVVKQGLSVRQTEKLAAKPAAPPKKSTAKDPHVAQIEDDLRRRLGTKVQLRAQSNGRGKIEIEYYGLDELDRLLAQLKR